MTETTDSALGYDLFADVYDRHWSAITLRMLPSLERLILSELETGSTVLDLCCGSGRFAAALSGRGFSVVGVDVSEEMISLARRNAPGCEFIVADARSFVLPVRVDAAFSTFDSLNHLMTSAALGRAFSQVAGSLVAGGPFVFDLKTREGMEADCGGSFGIVTDREVIVGRSAFNPDECTCRTDFTVMALDEGSWTRRDLALTQRCYPEEQVLALLKEAGFVVISVVDARELALDEVGRSFFRCRRAER